MSEQANRQSARKESSTLDECNSFTQKPTHLFSYFNLRLEFRGREKKKAKAFPSPVYPCTHRAPWISTESGDREQTGELFQKPHSEDPVSRLMAPILAFHQPASQWTHCSALTASSGPLANIIPTARTEIVPLQNIRTYIYKDITTSAIVVFGFRRMFQDEARTQSAEGAAAFPRRAAVQTWHRTKSRSAV